MKHSDVMLIFSAESKGYTREILLAISDKFKSSPLHAAINSGNIEVYL